MKYADGATQLLLGKNVPLTNAITVNFAEHGINVVNMILMRRSFSLSMVLVAIIPGTPQPVAIRIGIKLFPLKLKRRNNRSITKAMRAI